ncbi:MAG: class I SAM-dependent methyltransferase [Methanoregula sp.]|nr:class I SAM-dependent methyltransferase [Methanoregula sp.]
MTPEKFFYHIFSPLPRQGPGCTAATQKAWSHLPSIKKNAQVLDVGCGTGAQTRDLTELTSGTITAVDNYKPFLETVSARAQKEGIGERIRTVNASMDALPFGKGQFDLLWSEGAIYIMGFEEGLRAWTHLCRKGGHIVVSDVAWFAKNPPEELTQFWEKEGYIPLTEDEKKDQVWKAGLRLIATFRLPEAGWWEHYYIPLLARVAELRKIHGADPALAAILDSCDHEAGMYRKYKRYYGYAFFVMQNL